jgi:hypothetical protein
VARVGPWRGRSSRWWGKALELLGEGAADREAVGDGPLGVVTAEDGVEDALAEVEREGCHERRAGR